MNPEFASGLRDFLLQAIDSDVAATRKVIQAMPVDKPDYAPDSKSTKALALAFHIAQSQVWFLDSVASGAFGEFGGAMPETVRTPEDVVAYYDQALPEAVAKVKAMPGEDLAKTVDFYGMAQLPNVAYLNWANIHTIHHRGQLSAYLRAMGGKVPSIYGGSADEPMAQS